MRNVIRSGLAIVAPRREAVLSGYSAGDVWQRRLWLVALLYLAALAAAGALFAFLGTSVLMPMAGILAILALLIIWALPDSRNPPLLWIKRLLIGFLIALLFWPDYLAFDFPGLPWITALRIFGVPLALVFLISLSVSAEFRHAMQERLAVTTWVNRSLLLFATIAFLSIAFSNDPASSLNRFVVAFLYWFIIFYASVWLFSFRGQARNLGIIVCVFAVVTSLTGVQEWRMQQIPWANHIPSFIVVDDPVIQTILSAKMRASTGIYRLKGKFTTPLGFAEFLAFSTPFLIYFGVYTKNAFVKILAAATLGLTFWAIIKTDSRLGAAGYFMSFVIFAIGWSITQWKMERASIFGPAITIAYPLIAGIVFAATFLVGQLRNMVWGTKAQSFSSQARELQVDMGIPKILAQPWGYGIGQGGNTLGYRNLAGTLTIDSYYLALGLEFGVLGFLFYAAIFFAALAYGSYYLLKAQTKEHLLLIPFMSVIIIFIVEKAVFAQQENHPLVFTTLGALCAMCWRIRNESADTRS